MGWGREQPTHVLCQYTVRSLRRVLTLADLDAAGPEPLRPSVFISYASNDREAARLLRDALPDYGLEVWYDESELGGGDAWDQKIRRQIRECDFFMPVVSAQTEVRPEGYFRREWRLAVERTLDMADDHLFLLPIVIDDTNQSVARVPEKFLTVQWLRVPGGRPTSALEALCRRVASGNVNAAQPAKSASRRSATSPATSAPPETPLFPREEPGQRIRFWVEVVGWSFRSLWLFYKRLPRWLRYVVAIWITVLLVSHSNSSKHQESAEVSQEKLKKLAALSDKKSYGSNAADLAKVGQEIAKEFADESTTEDPAPARPLLAIPFTAQSSDTAAAKWADSTLTLAIGQISRMHRGQVSLTDQPLASQELSAAVERGRAVQATYVLWGTVKTVHKMPVLTVDVVTVADGAVLWSKSYPANSTDAASIAAEVAANVPLK
jgi:TolB-like protein